VVDFKEKNTLVVYSEEYWKFDFGRTHPMRPIRIKLFYMLLEELFGADSFFVYRSPSSISEDFLYTYHSKDYIEKLKSEIPDLESGLGTFDNPLVPGIFEWAFEAVKGTVTASNGVSEFRVNFNPGGGMHHAHPSKASGFCYLNDIVVAVNIIKRERPDLRILYLDMDAHHGDAVQSFFYRRDDVLFISIHQEDIFPLSGKIDEMGEDRGYGYTVNVPIPRYSEDEDVWYIFEKIVFPLLERYEPDIVFVQLGADAHRDDPLTNLYLTTGIYKRVSEELARLFKGSFVVTGGGGYDIVNVARIWTIFVSSLAGVKVPDRLPEKFLRISIMEGYDGPFIEDIPSWSGLKSQIKDTVKERVDFLIKKIPLLARG
jgi:acetoin utilization protein AcuC